MASSKPISKPAAKANSKAAPKVAQKVAPIAMPPKRVLCWLDTSQAALFRELASAANLVIVGAGSPARTQTGAVAVELEASPIDDLRVALTEGDADAILIGALGDFGKSDAASDAAALLAARARNVAVITLEPFPLSAIDLATRGWLESSKGVRPADVARFVPLPRHSKPFRDATELFATLGEVRSVAIESLGNPTHGTLAARLVTALDTVGRLLGEPDSIDAAYCSPIRTSSMHTLPGESLAELQGDIAANLRFPGGRAASLLASNRAGAWAFSCTVIGTGGRLRLHDGGFEFYTPEGVKADESGGKKGAKGAGVPTGAVGAIADAVARALDSHIPDTGPVDWSLTLSMAQAVLLSARTGQGESTETFRAMLSRTAM